MHGKYLINFKSFFQRSIADFKCYAFENSKVKVKVPCNSPRKVQRRDRGIALLIIDLGAGRSGWSAARPGRFTPGKDPVYIVHEAVWARNQS
jgi:hypothetical protein